MNFPSLTQTTNPALGDDMAGVADMSASDAVSSGRQCLGENLARRLETPKGALIDDPNYGFDVTARLGDDVSAADVLEIQNGCEAEFLKDERVLAAAVTVQFVGLSQIAAAVAGTVTNPQPVPQGALVVTAIITDSTGPFKLVLAVTSLTVQLLQVTSS